MVGGSLVNNTLSPGMEASEANSTSKVVDTEVVDMDKVFMEVNSWEAYKVRILPSKAFMVANNKTAFQAAMVASAGMEEAVLVGMVARGAEWDTVAEVGCTAVV